MLKKVIVALGLLLLISSCGGGGGSDSTGFFTVNGATRLMPQAPSRLVELPDLSNISPSSVKMKVYALYLGDNNNCTDIQLNYDNGESVSYVEFADNPVLFDSDTAAGTYGCMVIKASDIIKFTPNAEAVAAITECGAEEYGHDIFWYDGGENSEEWYDPSTGEVVAAEGNRANHVEQDVYLYFPYDPDAALSANSKLSPNQIIPMSSKIEIVEGGATSGTLMIDFTNKVEQDMGYCTLDSPEVEFTLSVE